MAWRWRGTGFLQRDNRDLGKSCPVQIISNLAHIVIPEGRSGEKTQRIIREHSGRCLCDNMGELVCPQTVLKFWRYSDLTNASLSYIACARPGQWSVRLISERLI